VYSRQGGGNVSIYCYQLDRDVHADSDGALVAVATLTVMALGAAVVPMCESILSGQFNDPLLTVEKSLLHQSRR
jgi:hypothetical protein